MLSPFRFVFVHHHGIVEKIITWLQYGILGIHLMAVFGTGWKNKLGVVLVLLLLLLADVYASYYTLNQLGIGAPYPTPWQAFKEFFTLG